MLARKMSATRSAAASSRAKPSMTMRVKTADGRTFYLGQQRTGTIAGPASRAMCAVLLAVYKWRRRHELREAGLL